MSPEKSISLSDTHEYTQLEKEAWPTLKKYGIAAVPILAFLVTSVTIINNANYRYVLEDITPSYGMFPCYLFEPGGQNYFNYVFSSTCPVQFIRDYYGFSDEDLDERRRIKNMIQEQSSRKSL